METDVVPEILWSRLSDSIAERLGLHFPPERRADLRRGLAKAAGEFGFAEPEACADWLLSTTLTRSQLQVLASHLTVGETYFFRERRTFDLLARRILPEMVRARRNRERRLRIWSAACCTGEEPYSLAILLSQAIPDLADWNATILATDVNERFLQKAAAGIYGEWSFRETPPGFRERYFQRTPDGRYAILPEIKRHVTFAYLNLVEDVFPALATDTNAMDLIFCRNVLMYFTPPQVRKVVGNLRRALVAGGWLVVSPSEVSQTLFAGFRTENFPGVVLYRKSDAKEPPQQTWNPPLPEPAEFIAPPFEAPFEAPTAPSATPWLPPERPPALPAEESVEDAPPPTPTPAAVAAQLYQEGRFAEASETLLRSPSPPTAAGEYSLLARALANQGQLGDALAWCDRWLATDKLDPSGHYLRAVVLQELGDRKSARQALQRATYLRPDLVVAHFALGNLARADGRTEEADRHFANALHLLRGYPPGELLPESDGLTADRLTEIITSLLAMETVP